MLIKVKVGEVEIEYSEPTTETDYPRCVSHDSSNKIDGASIKHNLLLKTIKEMADKAAAIHANMEA
jgi:hypothetical protein